MKEIQNNQEIPIPEGLEQRLSALVDRLEAEENERKAATLPHRGREARLRGAGLRVAGKAVLAIAAAFVAFAFLVIVPQVRARQELARYEGSYTVVDGRRIDDLGRIRTAVDEALAQHFYRRGLDEDAQSPVAIIILDPAAALHIDIKHDVLSLFQLPLHLCFQGTIEAILIHLLILQEFLVIDARPELLG